MDDSRDDYASAFAEISRLLHAGDSAGAVVLASSIAAGATDPRLVGRALSLQVGQLINLGRTQECPALLDRAFEALGELGDHAVLAGLHALTAIVAAESSFERCTRHLILGTRELERVQHPRQEAVHAARELSVSFSYAGFHVHAMAMAERAYLQAQAIGEPPGDHAIPEIAVRRAAALDHRGDTEGCVRLLYDVLHTWSKRVGVKGLWRAEQYYYSYAAVRLAALGEPVTIDRAIFAGDAAGWEMDDLRLLAEACIAIVDGRADDALAQLAGEQVNPLTLGVAEIPRVRALAHAALGEYQSAVEENRRASRLATEVTDDLRNRILEGTGTQLDHEALRRTVEQYASDAVTDPLTGLPNRRHFQRRVVGVAESGHHAAIGIVDLDDFKAVNSVHGHLGGDLVLQRVAAVLARAVRCGDFVARYGGDEFVVVLPDTDLPVAREVGARITSAIAAEHWESLVPGTPVSVTTGWAPLADPRNITEALEIADREMLGQKHWTPQPVGPHR